MNSDLRIADADMMRILDVARHRIAGNRLPAMFTPRDLYRSIGSLRSEVAHHICEWAVKQGLLREHHQRTRGRPALRFYFPNAQKSDLEASVRDLSPACALHRDQAYFWRLRLTDKDPWNPWACGTCCPRPSGWSGDMEEIGIELHHQQRRMFAPNGDPMEAGASKGKQQRQWNRFGPEFEADDACPRHPHGALVWLHSPWTKVWSCELCLGHGALDCQPWTAFGYFRASPGDARPVFTKSEDKHLERSMFGEL